MATDPQLELRVTRLENDRDSIYDLITEIRSTQQDHSRRFDALDRRFDALDQRFDAVDQRFVALDQRFDAVDHRLTAVDQHLTSIDATLAEILRRIPEPS